MTCVFADVMYRVKSDGSLIKLRPTPDNSAILPAVVKKKAPPYLSGWANDDTMFYL